MAIALVGTPQGACAASNVASLTTATGMNITGATLMVVELSYFVTGNTLTFSSTSNASGNWNVLGDFGVTAVNGFSRLYYCFNPTISASEKFTISSSGTDFYAINAVAFSGTLATGAVYQAASNKGASTSGSATTLQPGSVTPSQAGALVITGWASGGSASASISIDSGFTSVVYQHNGSGDDSAIAYLITANTNPVNPTWTFTSEAAAASIAVFLPAAEVVTTPIYMLAS